MTCQIKPYAAVIAGGLLMVIKVPAGSRAFSEFFWG